jgi:hypothetical protein
LSETKYIYNFELPEKCACEPKSESCVFNGGDIFSNVKQLCLCNKRLYLVGDLAVLAFDHSELFDILKDMHANSGPNKELRKLIYNKEGLKVLWDNGR